VPPDWLDDASQDIGEIVLPWSFLPHRFKVPARSEVHGGGLVVSFFISFFRFIFAPFFRLSRTTRGAVLKVMRNFHWRRPETSHSPVVIGYVPIEIFLALCAITFGIYPYAWLWNNSRAFVQLCGSRLRVNYLRRFAAAGFCAQLLLPAMVAAYVVWRFTGSERIFEIGLRCCVAYALFYALFVFPQRCYYFFALRWNMRSAVASWDRDGVMIDRTMMSWLKLFALGSVYIQLHSNRLIGLGMPGFADQDEILPDFSLGRWLREYLIAKKHTPEMINDLQEEGVDG
jgi:hypothetical protein